VVFIFLNFKEIITLYYNHLSDDIQLNENVMQKLLHSLHNNEYKDKRRNIEDEFENWNGRWMPDRPDDPKPPPKVFPKNQQQYEYESVTELPHKMYWPGHWMPDRPGNPKPPPKVFPKNQQQHEYESITELPEGWMPEKLNDLKLPFKILSNNEQSHEYKSIEEFPHEIYMGRVSPECDDAKVSIFFIYKLSELKRIFKSYLIEYSRYFNSNKISD